MGNIPVKSQKQQANENKDKRMYQSIWEAVKAAETGKEVEIKCHSSNAARIIQAVKKEKTNEVAVKKKIGMLRQGALTIRKVANTDDDTITSIFFSLSFDGTKL